MRLILIRHAKAGERDSERWPDDDLRPLDDEGREIQRRVARALARMDLGITHMVSSPLLRAVQTAEITAEALGRREEIEFADELAHGYGVAELARRLSRYPADAVVAAFGHEPHMSDFTAAMLDGRGTAQVEFKKSGVLALDFSGPPRKGGGALRFYFPPKPLLAAIGK